MGVYSSSFVVPADSSNAVSGYSHPNKANWITAHAISTELSIAEVERLWVRFQQMGCNADGVLPPEAINTPALSSDVFMKNILKYFKGKDGSITFETFLRALRWCETQELRDKARGIFQMLNNGNPIPKELFVKIMSRVYPNDRPEEVRRVTDSFFKTVDTRNKGQLEENDFVATVLKLPSEPVTTILNFHILPENMREDVHRKLPEFSNRPGNTPSRSPAPVQMRPPSMDTLGGQIPTDGVLREIAEKVHRRDWDLLANSLGFLAEDVENYRLENPTSSSQQNMTCRTNHTEEEHVRRLNFLCRLCGERVKRRQEKSSNIIATCVELAEDILRFHNISVNNDNEGQHPKEVCVSCYARIRRLRNTKQPSQDTTNTASEQIQKATVIWTEFDPSVLIENCTSCKHTDQRSKPGRPTKTKLGPPSKRKIPDDLSFPLPSLENVTSTPVKCPRNETHDVTATPVKCNCKKSKSMPDETLSPVKRKRIETTEAATNTSPFEQQKQTTVRPVEQLSAPLQKEEEKMLTALNKVKLLESDDKVTIWCKTGGQPLMLKKFTKPRKNSAVACSPLRKKRANETKKFRMDFSGTRSDKTKQQRTDGECVDPIVKQHATELKTVPKARRQLILKSAGYGEVKVSAKQGAALRVMSGLSLTKYREHKRFLKCLGVKFASEEKEKKTRVKAQSGEVEVELRNFVFIDDKKKEHLQRVPIARIEDIPSFVTKLLDEYDKQDRLTWHEGSIPNEEIWIKIGGDHGGGSFKLMLQVANLQNANSKSNTFLLAIVECKDSPENLRRIIAPFRPHLDALMESGWRDKKIKLFMFGDYDFLTKMYGLSGAQGIHPCLYCTASKLQIHMPQEYNEGNIIERTLKQLKDDYARYCRGGKKKNDAKHFNNVIRKPVLKAVELECVAPPYLHCLLGIVKKHHDMLKEDCHGLDEKFANILAKTDKEFEDAADDFLHYVEQQRAKETGRKSIRQIRARLAVMGDASQKETALEKINHLQEKIKTLRDPLPPFSGPLAAHLDTVLQENRIYPQAYHGGALVGNHCNKYLKAYENICQSVVKKAEELTDNASIVTQAQSVCDKYKRLNKLYAEVHQRISHQKPMTEVEIVNAEHSINQYMAYFRHNFTSIQIIPKQHLVEKHCIPWMRRWKLGMALHGEHGEESSHALVNSLKRRVWGIRCPQQRLKTLMTEHLAQVSPYFYGVIPLKK